MRWLEKALPRKKSEVKRKRKKKKFQNVQFKTVLPNEHYVSLYEKWTMSGTLDKGLQ